MDTAVNIINIEPLMGVDDSSVKVSASRGKAVAVNPKKSFNEVESVDIQIAQRVTEKIQGYIDRMNVSLKFSTYGEKNDKISVTVIEKKSGEIVREIPPEEFQRLQTRMEEVIGLIFNGKA